jgi:hypothetical protein
VKSLGAKTNHLPNIQGMTRHPPLQEVAGTRYFGSKAAPQDCLRIGFELIIWGTRESEFP